MGTSIYGATIASLQNRVGQAAVEPSAIDDVATLSLASEIFDAALFQALFEMLQTSTAADYDEEQHTGSLMGHLTSTLSWFAQAHMWTSSDEQSLRKPAEIFWAHQPRHLEWKHGGDFGLARRIDEDHLEIKLFQAKRAPLFGPVDLYRKVADPELASQAMANALNNLPRSNNLEVTQLHQIHRFAITSLKGSKLAGYESDQPWCYYVYWHRAEIGEDIQFRFPSVQSVQASLAAIRKSNTRNGVLAPELKLNVIPSGMAFHKCAVDSSLGLRVSIRLANDLLNDLAKITLPNFLLLDEEGGDEGFWSQIFDGTGLVTTHVAGLSNSLPPPKPADIPVSAYRPRGRRGSNDED